MCKVELTKQREGLGIQVEETAGAKIKNKKQKKLSAQQPRSSDAYRMEEGGMGEGEEMEGREKRIH